MNRIAKALELATMAHQGQTRKYTGEPYVKHAERVAEILSPVCRDEAMICAALLHDTLEDTDLAYQTIVNEIGEDVAQMVSALTKKTIGYERSVANVLYRTKLAHVDHKIQTIKLADIADNASTIAELDPVFAGPYLMEKRALLEVLTKGDPILYHLAAKRVFDGLRRLRLV